ncbi:MAG: thiamine-phosphate pyrophosphorylase [Candidatus Omnitrophota bacterium]
MPNASDIRAVYRIIDANINRAKEGLRVCEEIARFILENRKLTAGFKSMRHAVTAILKRLPAGVRGFVDRDSAGDIGRKIYADELRRKDWQDIFYANMQRAKESIRVLEEFVKLSDKTAALKFKKIRYDLYGLEKDSVKLVSSCRGPKRK